MVIISSVLPAFDYPWKPGLNPDKKIPIKPETDVLFMTIVLLSPTTTFLKPIYAPLSNKTIVIGGVTKQEFWELIINYLKL